MPYQSIGFTLQYTNGESIIVDKDEGRFIWINDVCEYAIGLIKENPKREFELSGTVYTNYSNRDFKIEYKDSVCVKKETDFYWNLGEDDSWDDEDWREYEEDDDPENEIYGCDDIKNYCKTKGIEPTGPVFKSLKEAYNDCHGFIEMICCNDEETEYFISPPWEETVIYRV